MYKRSPLEKRLRLRRGCKVYVFWGYDYLGKRYETTTHQTDWKAALNAAREIERVRAAAPVDAVIVNVCTLEGAFSLLAAHDVRVGAKPNTVRFHTDRSKHLLRLLGETTACTSVDLATLEKYTDKRLIEKADRHTIQKEHRVLRQALRLAGCDVSGLKVAGFVRRKHFYKPGCTWLESAEHVQALLAEVCPTRRDDIMIYVNLGVRRRELLTLTRARVDLRKRTVRVEELDEVTVKTEQSERTLDLNDNVLPIFTRRVRVEGPLFSEWGSGNRDLMLAWKRARAKLNDDELPHRLTFNDLRRTFCSLLRNAGVSLEDCADLLGHADITMVRQVYGHASKKTLKSAIAKMPSMSYGTPAISDSTGPSGSVSNNA